MDHYSMSEHLMDCKFLPGDGDTMDKPRYGAIIFAVIFTAAIVLLLR
jgi:hypothetical protein